MAGEMKSKAASGDVPEVSPAQVAAFRLSRHHLVKRAPAGDLARVAGDMAGVQAQLMSAAQISLWARTRGLRPEDIERALWEDRTLVKIWCMRGTVHLVPAEDHAMFVRGCTKRTARALDWMARAGIPAGPVDRLLEAVRQALDRPRTRKELAVHVSESLGIKLHAKGGRGWGGPADAAGFEVGDRTLSVGGILFLACMRGIACSGPDRGNEATFVRPDVWLPHWRDMPQEEAEEGLLRRYLRAFAPASVQDFALWTYMTIGGAREIFERLGSELASVSVGGRTAWALRADGSALRRAKIERPSVRLLPYFDAFLLGHKEKTHLVDAAHYKRVYRAQGWLSPVVLVDGRAAGVWSHERKGARLSVRVTPFRAMPQATRALVREEADDLGRFLGTAVVSTRFS